jgi:LysM domain-containing protein
MQPSLRGVVWFAWGGVAVLLAATVIFGLYNAPERVARQTATSQPARPADTAPAPPVTATTPAAREAKPLSFDIVTVDRNGQAVIAGRALPGDRVRVLDGDRLLGEVSADSRGEWVLVPEAPIPAGDLQLAIEATSPEGGAVRRSPDIVALSVLPRGKAQGETAALAVLLPGEPGAPARILQRPQDPAGNPTLSLDAAEYGGPDELVLSGNAEPGARLNIYAGSQLLGSATADASGKWALRSAYRTPTGGVELRLDQLAADGTVVHRVAAPFNLPTGMALRQGDTYVVERGNSLWLIARRVYGKGTRYTAIYAANQNTIRDPHRIYPGQELKLPQP